MTRFSCLISLLCAAQAEADSDFYDTDHIVSWDRGFDADGDQVWGAEEADYQFESADEPEDTRDN